jgi:transposase-like protein
MNLIAVNRLFPTEDKCRELLVRLRWPNGPECLRCRGKAVELETEKQLFYCKECDYQFTVTAGTVFNDSHLPLVKWLIVALLLCEAKKGISACQIQRTLGISYKTAWYLCHRIRAAMKEVDPHMMGGTIEMDETYIGGKKRNVSMAEARDSKEIVIGLRQRGGELRYFHADDVKSGTLAKFINDNIAEEFDVLMTDDFAAYPSAMKKAGINPAMHQTINHSKKVYVVGNIHTNTIENAFSLLKRGIRGTWHHLSAKHLLSYLDEMTFRFNRRNSDVLFLDTLRHMVTAPVLTFKKLTA